MCLQHGGPEHGDAYHGHTKVMPLRSIINAWLGPPHACDVMGFWHGWSSARPFRCRSGAVQGPFRDLPCRSAYAKGSYMCILAE